MILPKAHLLTMVVALQSLHPGDSIRIGSQGKVQLERRLPRCRCQGRTRSANLLLSAASLAGTWASGQRLREAAVPPGDLQGFLAHTHLDEAECTAPCIPRFSEWVTSLHVAVKEWVA
mmetsp:Transcript_69011/g.131515  ORF Transcript_69011/g.131515 Transcript_69011/m.131515 type:complete len:118 (+) Transcript_69011:260-613(+)